MGKDSDEQRRLVWVMLLTTGNLVTPLNLGPTRGIGNFMLHLLPLLLNILLVVAAIYLHYEVLNRLSRMMPTLPLKPRSRIIVGVMGVLLAHGFEVTLFAAGFWLEAELQSGFLIGDFNGSFSDYMYFSFAAFTTLGFGDIVPEGHLRWLTGIEALTGFVLITWSASYLFLEMSQNWRHD